MTDKLCEQQAAEYGEDLQEWASLDNLLGAGISAERVRRRGFGKGDPGGLVPGAWAADQKEPELEGV